VNQGAKSKSDQKSEAFAMQQAFTKMYGQRKTSQFVTLNSQEFMFKARSKIANIQILLIQKYAQCYNITG